MSQTRRDFLRQTGCAALGAGALAAGIGDFGLVNALAQTGAPDYRALVCVFLNGGNDGNNAVVPTDDRYALYANERAAAGLAIPAAGQPNGLLQLGGVPYGLHPALAGLHELFNAGKCAVLFNTGPLVQPITKSAYQGNAAVRPPQLFSHSDQVAQWQTSVSGESSLSGWGGRVADHAVALNAGTTFPQTVSIAGINLFLTATLRPLAVAPAPTALSGLLPLTMTGPSAETAARRAAFDQIRAQAGGTLVRASADVTTAALRTSAALATANPTVTATFPTTTLGNQLKQVALIIKACSDQSPSNPLRVNRQVFFVQLGGFDHHSGQMNAAGGQGALLTQVSQAVKAFYDETVAQGIADKVTTFTLSDFGRTFQPAGAGGAVGSDHAWGNHHFIVGGAVRGGQTYGTFPALQRGGPDDTDSGPNPRGRWIPTTSVEQYAATLATWYGLAPGDLTTVFPSVSRFATANLGFMV